MIDKILKEIDLVTFDLDDQDYKVFLETLQQKLKERLKELDENISFDD